VKFLAHHKITSVVLSFLVLFSTLSFSIEKHFCGDNLVDTAVFTKAKSCCASKIKANTATTKDSCCKNEIDYLSGQDELQLTAHTYIPLVVNVILPVVDVHSMHVFAVQTSEKLTKPPYKPPQLVKDIHIHYETFLI